MHKPPGMHKPFAPFGPLAPCDCLTQPQPLTPCLCLCCCSAVDEIKVKLWPTLRANYMLWPAAHLINFAFVPGDLRILYINVIALFWTCFLSIQANKKH